jgi:hypothetical protein
VCKSSTWRAVRILSVLGASLGAGCSGSGPAPSTAPAVDALGPIVRWDGGPDVRGVDARSCGAQYSFTFDRRDADVLVLFDRSASMVTELGGGTRFSAESKILSDLLTAYDDKLRFGFQQFPAPGPCPAGYSIGCCAQPTSVPVALRNGPPIIDAIAGAAPVSGNTPTAEALRYAREYFHGLQDGIADRYVLLSTDGRPSCSAKGKLVESDIFDPSSGVRTGGACFDALQEVEALVADGVKVVVLGVGSGLENDPGGVPACLEELAVRGGLPRPEGRPRFYPGSDPEKLELALQQIFGGVSRPPCVFDLDNAPFDPDRVAVLFDGQAIPRSRMHGWDYDPPEDTTRIKVFGDYCRRLEQFQVTTLDVSVACPPPASCE